MSNVPVKFLKAWGLFNSGEVAGFTPETARGLIDGKVASAYDAKAEKAASNAPDPARIADLEARERALADREAAVADAEARAAASDKGAPPAQGSGDAAKSGAADKSGGK